MASYFTVMIKARLNLLKTMTVTAIAASTNCSTFSEIEAVENSFLSFMIAAKTKAIITFCFI